MHVVWCGVGGGEYCMYLMVLGDIKALLVVPHTLFGQWESRDLERERERVLSLVSPSDIR